LLRQKNLRFSSRTNHIKSRWLQLKKPIEKYRKLFELKKLQQMTITISTGVKYESTLENIKVKIEKEDYEIFNKKHIEYINQALYSNL
jgi:hypothetical protein